jgi:hypothetical protein
VVHGAEMPTSGWGRTVVPAPPGQYHVHVHAPYLLPSRVGPADITVNVAPGHLVELEYKAPVWTSALVRSARRRRPTTGRPR